MKKIYFLVVVLCFLNSINAQIINFPDYNFIAKLLVADTNNTIAKDLTGVYFKIDANSDGQIQQSEALSVSYLEVVTSNISDLTGIEYFPNLTVLNCSNNQLTNLNVVNNTALSYLNCFNNQLTNLNVNSNTSLTILNCDNNQLTTLNVSNNTALLYLYCSYNQLTNLNVSNNAELTNFNCNNNQLTNLNVSSNVELVSLGFSNNQLTSLDVSNNIALVGLYCSYNLLADLNVNSNIALNTLSCNSNILSSLNVSSNTALQGLSCRFNQLTSLNVSSNTALKRLICGNNPITSLDVSNNISLNDLYCNNNQLSSLDVSNNTNLFDLDCSGNQLATLFMKNGRNELSNSFFSNNPNLQYICADESQIVTIQNLIVLYGYTNCQVNTYCSFTPGGAFYTIQGNNKYDENNNGCDALDVSLSNLKYNITEGTNTGSLISNSSGNYSIPVQAGTHTITPVLENPTYFSVSPTNVIVDFPTLISPFTQDFCVAANGVHPDLEISLLPTNAARPGFDAKYKIIYKNKGNTTQSGTVNLAFNDAVLDFVSAIPATANQSVNNLSWAFSNLLPFETREISLTLNVNSPTETPAVNGGDILNYTTTITSSAIDDLPNDNTFVFNQTVVNSFDPNDKTCLQGATIAPEKVGDYVHYMIRFENTGTFPAENIVVKDMIDTAKFDVSSLITVKGSHSFVTNITSGNKVEFIFENINLPFDDANNDGYIAFKIKTKPTLVNGNTFSNTASIYFDYNFPIVTNTATTTIAALSIQDFVFSNYFNIYPNPVSSVLSITQKENITISSINIYNTLGQLVLVIPNAKNTKTIDISKLTTGNYFIKINSDKGTSNTKFVKN